MYISLAVGMPQSIGASQGAVRCKLFLASGQRQRGFGVLRHVLPQIATMYRQKLVCISSNKRFFNPRILLAALMDPI